MTFCCQVCAVMVSTAIILYYHFKEIKEFDLISVLYQILSLPINSRIAVMVEGIESILFILCHDQCYQPGDLGRNAILSLSFSTFSSSCSALTRRKPSRLTNWLRWKELARTKMTVLKLKKVWEKTRQVDTPEFILFIDSI
jgi:hypothetical protein